MPPTDCSQTGTWKTKGLTTIGRTQNFLLNYLTWECFFIDNLWLTLYWLWTPKPWSLIRDLLNNAINQQEIHFLSYDPLFCHFMFSLSHNFFFRSSTTWAVILCIPRIFIYLLFLCVCFFPESRQCDICYGCNNRTGLRVTGKELTYQITVDVPQKGQGLKKNLLRYCSQTCIKWHCINRSPCVKRSFSTLRGTKSVNW